MKGADYDRTRRIGALIHKHLGVFFKKSVNDDRLTQVIVSSVEISRDLSSAFVYVSFFDVSDKERISEAMRALKNASGMLRKSLTSVLSCRKVPKLHFYYDSSLDHGSRMHDLIHRAITEDQQHQDL